MEKRLTAIHVNTTLEVIVWFKNQTKLADSKQESSFEMNLTNSMQELFKQHRKINDLQKVCNGKTKVSTAL